MHREDDGNYQGLITHNPIPEIGLWELFGGGGHTCHFEVGLQKKHVSGILWRSESIRIPF
jgi:hypothetical protein